MQSHSKNPFLIREPLEDTGSKLPLSKMVAMGIKGTEQRERGALLRASLTSGPGKGRLFRSRALLRLGLILAPYQDLRPVMWDRHPSACPGLLWWRLRVLSTPYAGIPLKPTASGGRGRPTAERPWAKVRRPTQELYSTHSQTIGHLEYSHFQSMVGQNREAW